MEEWRPPLDTEVSVIGAVAASDGNCRLFGYRTANQPI